MFCCAQAKAKTSECTGQPGCWRRRYTLAEIAGAPSSWPTGCGELILATAEALVPRRLPKVALQLMCDQTRSLRFTERSAGCSCCEPTPFCPQVLLSIVVDRKTLRPDAKVQCADGDRRECRFASERLYDPKALKLLHEAARSVLCVAAEACVVSSARC